LTLDFERRSAARDRPDVDDIVELLFGITPSWNSSGRATP